MNMGYDRPKFSQIHAPQTTQITQMVTSKLHVSCELCVQQGDTQSSYRQRASGLQPLIKHVKAVRLHVDGEPRASDLTEQSRRLVHTILTHVDVLLTDALRTTLHYHTSYQPRRPYIKPTRTTLHYTNHDDPTSH